MKTTFKKATALLMGSFLALAAVGCGGGGTGTGGGESSGSGSGSGGGAEAKKIVIYAGGSSEFSWVAGSEEEKIINYIEDKYYNDTGVKLDFEVSYLGQELRSKMESEIAAGTQIDLAISHTRGGAGIDDVLKGANRHYNLYDAIYDYAPNLYEYIKGAPLDGMTTVDNDVIGIPSVISPYKFGILVRKDLMEKAGYTDDAEKAKTEFKDGVNYQLVDDLITFENMCLAIKEQNNLSHTVTGAIWDLEKVLTLGAYGDAGYFTNVLVEEGGKKYIRRGAATPEYGKVLDVEYRWANNGVISKDANSTLLEQAEQNFTSGKTAVFVEDPTIQHLIKVARMTKKNIPEAEFTVLGPLTSGEIDPQTGVESTKKGFMRNAWSTFGAVVPASSRNVKELLGFANWMFKSADNYNLCKYGIEGEHWVNNGDGTYSYPAGKEGYETSPAYSGILSFVENQRISNLTYKGYTAEELRWIQEIAGNPDNYIQNDLIDYLFVNTSMNNVKEAAATSPFYAACCEYWVGRTNPATNFTSVMNTYNEAIPSVQEYLANQYYQMKSFREE